VREGWRKKGLREREESEGGMSERGGWRRESVREGEECEEGWEWDGGRGEGWREGVRQRHLSLSFTIVVRPSVLVVHRSCPPSLSM
jgi:hypothetical protein